jgi:AraC-like DNA-binding protein
MSFQTKVIPLFHVYLALIAAQTHDRAMPSYARAMQEGDVEAAHRHAQRLGGTDAPALQALGDAALLLGHEEDAEDHFRRAHKLQASNDAVRLLSCRNAGWQALNLQRYGAALHCFARIVQDGAATVPGKIEALLGAALVHHQLAQQAACDDALRRARALGAATGDGRWLLLADLLALDCAVRLRVRRAAGLRDHAYWQSAPAPGDPRARWERLADAMAACDAHRPAPELVARRHACLALLLRLADGERDAMSVLVRNSTGDADMHVEIALAALAGGHVDLAEQSLRRGRCADPRDRRWNLDLRYCQARIAMLKGDSTAAFRLYAAYTSEALHCLRSEIHVARPLDGTAPPSDDISARLPARYRRAYRYIADHYRNKDLSTGEIAAHVGVTERALQLAFREHLGMSPTAVLRRMRLDAVRAELLAADGGTGGILETANRLGVKSRSSLIRGYRKQFNEAPSDGTGR